MVVPLRFGVVLLTERKLRLRTEPNVSVAGCDGSASTVNVERPLLRVVWLASGTVVLAAMLPNKSAPE